ncbi:MAG: hypothetical protein AAF628_06410 [Planctomycetota bacterium]
MKPACLFVASVFLVGAVGRAQDSAVNRHEQARLEFAQLTREMRDLRAVLAPSAPTESEALSAGGRFVQERRVAERMAAVREQLARGLWDEALEGMAGVRDDLGQLMNLLLNRDVSVEELAAEIERLEALRERLDALIGEQGRAKEAAARAEDLQRELRDLNQAAKAIDLLIDEQRAVRERAAQADAEEAGALQPNEATLANRATEVAARVESLDAEATTASDAGAAQVGAACRAAAARMSSAAQQLGDQDAEAALPQMDAALEELERAQADLAERAQKAREALQQEPLDAQARAQDATRAATAQLAEDMRGGEAPPAPGTENVEQAVPSQQGAAEQLRDGAAGRAKQSQQDAQEQLDEAAKALEEAVEQQKERLQEELVRALEERLGAMLAAQQELSARTDVADRLRREALAADGRTSTALRERCLELATGERGLADQADEALALLHDDGSTAVLPDMVTELRDDLRRVAERLADERTGTPTQAAQAEIEAMLQDLIDALRQSAEDSESGEGGQGDGEGEMVPTSTEVKLLLTLQQRVAARTKAYDGDVPPNAREGEDAKAEAAEIARKQGRVHDLTRKLATKMSQENAEEPR